MDQVNAHKKVDYLIIGQGLVGTWLSYYAMQAGKTCLVVNDSQIEDLIEHRLQAMANRLLNQPELWREQSAFFRQPLAQRDGQVEDVPERVTFDPDQQEDDHA